MEIGKKLFGKSVGIIDNLTVLVLAWSTIQINSVVGPQGLVVLLNFVMLIGGVWLGWRTISVGFSKFATVYLFVLAIAMNLFAIANMITVILPTVIVSPIRDLGLGLIALVVIPNFLAVIALKNLGEKKLFLNKKEVKLNESTKKVFSSTNRNPSPIMGN